MNTTEFDTYSIKRLNYLVFTLLLSSISCIILLFTRIIITGSYRYFFLIWNLFLAWIPFLISLMMYRIYVKVHISKFFYFLIFSFSFLWLIFYPNAPYILTDLIYIVNFPAFIPFPIDPDFITPGTILWYDIILSSSFSFIGHFIGLVSLIIIHRIYKNLFNKFIGWIFSFTCIYLTGFGIFMGRFIRLNSWDFFTNTSMVFNKLFSGLFTAKAVLFSLYFSTFIFITYLTVFSFHELMLLKKVHPENKNALQNEKNII
jgi:uncharacterized membrane protein